jgi:glycosyltransferase involved in cell wall biosynthesis
MTEASSRSHACRRQLAAIADGRSVRVAFLVNGGAGGPMGHRAQSFAVRLSDLYDIRIAHRSERKVVAILAFLAFLARTRPSAVYVFDVGYSGVLAACIYKWLTRTPMLIDTGDAIHELAKSVGGRGAIALWLTRSLERLALATANRIVVRGTFHQRLLSESGFAAEVIQDGVDRRTFDPPGSAAELRSRLGLDGVITIGLVGSSIWSERLEMCYGWELIEVMRLLRDEPVRGIMVGDGSGIVHLRERCREYGLDEKVLFLGRVPYGQLAEYLSVIDVCLSTQTNDIPGQVRTTGKLPLYLATGRYVLASRVGEAALVLDDAMLVDYHGVKDDTYPHRLAARIRNLLKNPSLLDVSERMRALGLAHFDYDLLAGRVRRLLSGLLNDLDGTESNQNAALIGKPGRLH